MKKYSQNEKENTTRSGKTINYPRQNIHKQIPNRLIHHVQELLSIQYQGNKKLEKEDGEDGNK